MQRSKDLIHLIYYEIVVIQGQGEEEEEEDITHTRLTI